MAHTRTLPQITAHVRALRGILVDLPTTYPTELTAAERAEFTAIRDDLDLVERNAAKGQLTNATAMLPNITERVWDLQDMITDRQARA